MKKIRWGIAGPGNIANKFAKAVKNVEGAELAAVASRSAENGNAFAKKYGIENVFVGYEEMAKSDAVDAVYISTPHPFHKPCAEIFLKAKKHVLCEKPLCVNAKEAEALKKCAAENGVFLMEAMWTRFLPAVHEARRILRSGEIGKPSGLSADFCYGLPPEEDPKLFDNKMAGGSLLDVGIYPLHFAAFLFGSEPESIYSTAHVDYDVDCHINMVLKYSGGEICSLSSAITTEKPDTAYIYGTDGYIRIPHFYGATELVVVKNGEETRIEKPCIGAGFEEEIIEASNCIREGKTESDNLPLDESIRILKIMDAFRKQNGIYYPFDDGIL